MDLEKIECLGLCQITCYINTDSKHEILCVSKNWTTMWIRSKQTMLFHKNNHGRTHFFSLTSDNLIFLLHPYGSPKRLERNKQAKHWIALINSEKGKSALFHWEAILTLSGIKTLWKPSTELLPVTHLLTGRFWLIGVWSFHSIIT